MWTLGDFSSIRGLLCAGFSALWFCIFSSFEHRVGSSDTDRALSAGGLLQQGYVGDKKKRTSKKLNLTRSFGDFVLKQDSPPIISCQPDVEIIPLSDEKGTYALIFGTDGVFFLLLLSVFSSHELLWLLVASATLPCSHCAGFWQAFRDNTQREFILLNALRESTFKSADDHRPVQVDADKLSQKLLDAAHQVQRTLRSVDDITVACACVHPA